MKKNLQKYKEMHFTRLPAVIKIAFVLVILMAVLGVALAVPIFTKVADMFQPSIVVKRVKEKVIVVPTSATVVTQMQSIGKLETVTFTLGTNATQNPDEGAWYRLFGERKQQYGVQGE